MEVIWVKTISCLGRCWWQKSAKAVLAGIAAVCSRNSWEGNNCCCSNTVATIATIAIAIAAAVLSIAAVVVGGINGLGRWQQQ